MMRGGGGEMMRGGGGETPKKLKPDTVKRVATAFKPYRGMVFVIIATVMVGVLLGLLPPWFLQIIIDDGLQKSNLGVIAKYSLLTVAVTIVASGLTLLYGYWSAVVGQKIMVDFRNRLFDHLQGMSLRFFTATRTGEIQSRLISDVGGVQNVVSNTFTDALSNAAIVLSTLIAMFIFDWRLTLLSIAVIPIFALFGQWMGNWARDVRKGTQEQTAELNAMMQETLSVSGILLTKTNGRRDRVTARFGVENQKLAGWQIKNQIIQYVFFGLIRMVFSLTPVLVYWFAGWLGARGDGMITVGTLVAFTALQTRMFFPLTGLMGTQVEVMSSMALFDRIFEYLDMPQEIANRPDAKVLGPTDVTGEVRFENVSFKYNPESEEHTLEAIDFEARPGRLVALVGPSGAGKTTLTYLIPRLYDVDAGRVTRRRRGPRHDRWDRRAGHRPCKPLRPRRSRHPGNVSCPRHGQGKRILSTPRSRRTSSSRSRTRPTTTSWPLARPPPSTTTSRACQTGTTRSSASEATNSPAARSSGSPSPARS